MCGESGEPIYFYSKTAAYYELSNFSRHGFQLDGVYWPTVEHYFQAQKFPSEPAYQERIRRARSPKDAKALGRSRKVPLRSDWEQIKDEVMRRALRAKFVTHAELTAVLLGTGDRELIENAPSDYYWGCGRTGTGHNRLGKLLMELRTALKVDANKSSGGEAVRIRKPGHRTGNSIMIDFPCPACGTPYKIGDESIGHGARCGNCRQPFLMARDRAAEIGRETVQFLEAGAYTTGARVVAIRDLLRSSVDRTCAYPPDHPLPEIQRGEKPTSIAVANESTLVAARRLVDDGLNVVALNFASATHPGGGFLSGSRAQEESLARSSGLYACLAGNSMYEFHQARRDAIYTNYAIYSPDVPIFRADDGTLLEKPWRCSFITAPAVNAKAVLQRRPSRRPEIRHAMRERIHKVLTIAAVHGHAVFVLGAWGCGAFGNESEEIAELFRDALAARFFGVFAKVVFAVTDWSKEHRFIGPFAKAFGD
jgi:uncharacterized protein (TIGR02452 family)